MPGFLLYESEEKDRSRNVWLFLEQLVVWNVYQHKPSKQHFHSFLLICPLAIPNHEWLYRKRVELLYNVSICGRFLSARPMWPTLQCRMETFAPYPSNHLFGYNIGNQGVAQEVESGKDTCADGFYP